MRARTYPGRLTREQWLKLTVRQRRLLAARADADLLELWRSCSKKPCRRAHACLGDERCTIRPYLADFKNPNFGQPDYVSSYRFPQHLRIPSAILNHLAFWHQPPAPEQILEECAAEAGLRAAAALRWAFRLERKRRASGAVANRASNLP
jgi:hypothetical protein